MARCLILLMLIGAALSRPQSGSAQVDAWSCSPASAATPQATPDAISLTAVPFTEDGALSIFAAASLTDAFSRMAEDIAEVAPNVDITFNFAGSQALVTQIAEGGAEADVLALASTGQMKNAVEAGIPAQDAAAFARNGLTVVVPSDNPAGIDSVADLANDGVRLVLANPDVPAGNYARQALCNVAAADGLEVAAFAANVRSQEDNVRSVLTKVEIGEADAGIVYVTDALTSGNTVKSIEFPENQNVEATYPIAAISDNPLAAAFVSYVLSDAGQAALESFGFESVG